MTTRHAFAGDGGHGGVDLADDDGGEAERDHLLLAAGERGARVVALLGEDGEQGVEALQVPGALAAGNATHQQVLFDAEAGEEAAAFGDHGEPTSNDLAGRQAADGFALKVDGFSRGADQAGETLEEG